jgi:hypothetical protein
MDGRVASGAPMHLAHLPHLRSGVRAGKSVGRTQDARTAGLAVR